MQGDIHVVPDGSMWAIAIEGTGTRTHYETRETAIAFARQLATQTRVELLIHGSDGEVSERDALGPQFLKHQEGIAKIR